MDFSRSADQDEIAKLADTILADQCPAERLRQLERERAPFHRDAWEALAGADLLGLAVPTELGGSGLGALEACLVAEQVGRHAAPVPYWPHAAAGLTLARWADAGQQQAWLPGAADGTAPLTVALWEPGVAGPAAEPTHLRARRDGAGWRLTGIKQPVAWAEDAAALLMPALVDGGDGGEDEVAVFLVGADQPGVTLDPESSMSQLSQHTVTFDDVRVGADGLVGAPAQGGEIAAWLTQRTVALLCATAAGVCDAALDLTARHVSQREQFGVPIGSFQAVAHRCADAYIDREAVRLTAWQAAWRLDAGLPADDALAVAAYWVADGGQRVVHAAQHLHGGLGVDTDYPLHRYFRWAKLLELLLGGSTHPLLRIGRTLAASGPRQDDGDER